MNVPLSVHGLPGMAAWLILIWVGPLCSLHSFFFSTLLIGTFSRSIIVIDQSSHILFSLDRYTYTTHHTHTLTHLFFFSSPPSALQHSDRHQTSHYSHSLFFFYSSRRVLP
ncbi:hypothetical protein F4810DRAFT_686733 [Camillea tinctor]|nr:hypothetical protein F4810DRAFT_686733 [Camillea tinctor]